MTLAQLSALAKRYLHTEERRDYRAAQICATLANCHRDPKKHKPFTPENFMPQQKKKQTPKQMLHTVRLLNAAFGGSVNHG